MSTTPPPTYSVSTLDGAAADLKHALTEATTPVAAAEKPLRTKHLNVENPVPVNVFVRMAFAFIVSDNADTCFIELHWCSIRRG